MIAGVITAELLEDYRGRDRVLTLQYEADGKPIHVVWAIWERRQAILVTGYRSTSPSIRLMLSLTLSYNRIIH